MKKSLEPLEKSRDIDKAIFKRRRTAGMVFVLGGAYTVFMLLFVVEFPYVVYALSENANPIIVAILVETLKWFLIASGLLALFVGIMMLVSENALPNLRAKLDRWHSADKLTEAAGEMHMPLDSLTETYPRATGIVLLVIAFAVNISVSSLRKRAGA